MAMTEEMLCRYGRRLRESGDSLVCGDGSSPDANAQVALDRYCLALHQYEQAYAISQGYYPGVNIATLRLRICAVSPPNSRNHRDLSAVKDLANRLMERRQQWPRNPSASDDEVWRIATTADCHLLCEQWSIAAENYQLAQRDRACQPFHVECMRRTAEGIVNCYKRIGAASLAPFKTCTTSSAPAVPIDASESRRTRSESRGRNQLASCSRSRLCMSSSPLDGPVAARVPCGETPVTRP